MKMRQAGIFATTGTAVAVWGLWGLLVNGSTPGAAAAAPVTWPTASQLRREPGRPTLIVIAHPRCPCTRATLAELDRLITRLQNRVTAYVIFVNVPGLTGANSVEQDLFASAARIPGVTVVRDADTYQRFQVETSGEALMYDPNGRLIFAGGITPERGCEGLNDGADSIERLVLGMPKAVSTTPVYGCPLKSPRQNDGR